MPSYDRHGWTGTVVTKARRYLRTKGRHQPCGRCGRVLDLDVELWTVGHILDRQDGGQNVASNYRVECGPCNFSAGAKRRHQREAVSKRGNQLSSQRLRSW